MLSDESGFGNLKDFLPPLKAPGEFPGDFIPLAPERRTEGSLGNIWEC